MIFDMMKRRKRISRNPRMADEPGGSSLFFIIDDRILRTSVLNPLKDLAGIHPSGFGRRGRSDSPFLGTVSPILGQSEQFGRCFFGKIPLCQQEFGQ